MTLTRKERIERVAAQWWAAYIASPTQSPWTHNDCIAEASKFIDTIDALPAEPDHIAEINARVDEVFGKPVDAPDAGEKVELLGKWTITYTEKRAVRFGGIINQNASAVSYARDESEALDFVAAANKLRELTFAAAFRAGVEAAAKYLESRSPLESRAGTLAQIRAIPTPALD